MRNGLITALALVCAGCSGSDVTNESRAARKVRFLPPADGPMDTFNVRVGGASGCYYELHLQTVEREALVRRAREILETAEAAAGGIDNMRASDIPYVSVQVDPEAPFSCLEPVLTLIRNPGYSRVGLEPYGPRTTSHFVHFPLTEMGAPPPRITVAIAADGRTTWNGEAVDRAQLGVRARALAESGREAGVPGTLRVAPEAATRFSAIYETIKVIRENGVEPDMGELRPLDPEMARTVRR